MAGFRKRILVLMMTIAMGSVVLVICSAQTATNGKESDKSKLDANHHEEDIQSEDSPFIANDQNYFKGSEYNTVGWEFLVKAILALLFVLALFVIAIYVSKKFLPKITNLSGKEIRIVETIHLGPRKTVHLLEIENRRFLIGSTNENITKLADLSGNLTDLSSNETNYN
jgi:flagellar biosynthetic protein FliO